MSMMEKMNTEIKPKKRSSPSTKLKNVPAKITINDCKKAISILSDKGGTSTTADIKAAFGGSREYVGRSLNSLVALGIIEKKGLSYILGETGSKFIAGDDTTKKQILKEKVIAYPPYKDVFIRLKNSPDKSIKKEEITDMWVTIVGGGKDIRQGFTMTFSSLTSYCGIVEDKGKTLVLIDVSVKPLETEKMIPITQQPPSLKSVSVTPSISSGLAPMEQLLDCPFCQSTDIGLKNEEISHTAQIKIGSAIWVKRAYWCRKCRSEFTRLEYTVVS